MKYINCTPHAIALNNGHTYEPSGSVARVSSSHDAVEQCIVVADLGGNGCLAAQTYGHCAQECLGWEPEFELTYGEIEGLPAPAPETLYIVSGLVLTAAKAAGRTDCRGPATGHPETVRNDKGHIVSVPGFVR